MSRYVSSVSPVNPSKPERKNQHQPKQYFDFYLQSKNQMRRGVGLSSQKQKLLEEIPKSGDENQGCIPKKENYMMKVIISF